MSQPRPNRRQVRKVPVNWADQEAAIESGQAGPVLETQEQPEETAVATAEPAAEVAQAAAQIPTRRARGAAPPPPSPAEIESEDEEEYEDEYEDEEEEEEEALPFRRAGARGKGGNQVAAQQAALARARGRQAAVPQRRTTRSMVMPIAIGIAAGAVLGLIIIGILISQRGNPTTPTQAANTQSQDSSNPAAAGANDVGNSPGVVPTQAGPVATPTVNLAEANATPSGLFDVGAASAARGRFNLPRGITADGEGNIYVSDTQNERIEKFDKSGKFLSAFGSKGSAEGQFNVMAEDAVGTGPSGMAVDASGNLYVADTWNHRVQKFDKAGKFITQWGSFGTLTDPDTAKDPASNSMFWGPRDIGIGPDGSVYVTDTGNKRVLIFDANGKFLRKIDSGLSKDKVDSNYLFNKPGEFNEPIGLAVDGAGNVYVADTRNNRVQKFDKDGKPAAQWPMPAGAWSPGPYLEPFLDLDSAGNVYVTAPTGKYVVEFSPDGKMLGQKNKEGNTTLQTPTGIMVTKDGTIYVVDTSANAVINFGKMP